jgi:S-adenosylmethionine:tRNA ribosyltransferase-isomerase
MSLSTADFDYALPEALIAQVPLRPRDAARLLLVQGDAPRDHAMRDLPALLQPGDVMVVNDTRVIPARLRARRHRAGGEGARVEIMLNRAEGDGTWHALIRNARRLRPGDALVIEGADLPVRVLEVFEGGSARLDLRRRSRRAGSRPRRGWRDAPAPLHRPPHAAGEDREDYQTVFAARPGAGGRPHRRACTSPRRCSTPWRRAASIAPPSRSTSAPAPSCPCATATRRRTGCTTNGPELNQAAAATINAARAEGRASCAAAPRRCARWKRRRLGP